MAKQVQFRRGSTSQHSTFTGAVGEITVDTDKDTVVVHDGSTAGGNPLPTSLSDLGVTATASELNTLDGVPATLTATELGYVDGVTSSIQTQIDGKQDVVANVSSTEIGYLDGVTSAIQAQIDGKSGYAEIAVTVSGGKFYLDGTQQQKARLTPSVTYRFDQSDSSNASHPLLLSTTSDGTHGGGSAFTTGVTTVGTAGSAGAYVEVTLEQDAPYDLYYYCSNHSGMGAGIEVSANNTLADFDVTASAAELNILDGATLTTTELNYVDGVTSAIQTQIDTKAPLASPALTGTPTAPTAASGTNTTQIATTAFVGTEVAALVDSAPATLDTLNELAAALGDDPNFATTVTNSIATKAPLASPSLTGTVSISGITYPTSDGTNGQVLTTNGTGTLSFSTISGYTDSDVDTHLNTGTAANGEFLSWNGTDYDWATVTTTVAIDDLTDGSSDGSSIGLGSGALSNDDGTTNNQTAVGIDALTAATTANGTTAVGFRSGYNLTTGNSNTHIGSFSGFFNTTDSFNTSVGVNSLKGTSSGATGTNNTAVGYRAGEDITGGDFNTFVGADAGKDVTSANDNTFVGYQAGLSATTGHSNTLIGKVAGSSITIGSENTYVGELSGLNANGYKNAGFGWGSLKGSADRSTGLGYQAGEAYTGENGVFVGHGAANSHTTGDNVIVIGADADASSTTAANEITLGNTSITRFRIPAAGIDNTSTSLSGTSVSVDVGVRDTYTHTLTGNTTYTFTGEPSSGQVGTITLIITGNGSTITWDAAVDWAGGTAPDAPASGETDVFTFQTINGGTTWYGFHAGDAMA